MADFNFLNLTDSVRELMNNEIELDISKNRLFISNRLNVDGKVKYSSILIESVKESSKVELAMKISNFLNEKEIVNGKEKIVPKHAASLLSQGEFNRFYIRAVCLEALKNGDEYVEIYRGRQSSWARQESELKIGKHLNVNELLEDLRTNIGRTPKSLPEVNSGLTVKLI